MALKSQKHVFWQALLVAVLIFAVGILIGYSLERWRANTILDFYSESDLDFMDLKLQSDLLRMESFDCQSAIEENINFGDTIFQRAIQLQNFEESQRISEALKQVHKKYDLLRTMFWVNSIILKERCDTEYHTLVYVYNYDPKFDEKPVQIVFSNFLRDLKEERPGEIILIPIAGNMGLNSLDYLLEEYEVEQLPVIVVDESEKVYEIDDLSKITQLIGSN